MDSIPKDFLINCKRCSLPLVMDLDLELMVPPVDDNVGHEMCDIIIPTVQTHQTVDMLEVPPATNRVFGYEINENLSIMGVSSTLSSKIMIANEIFKYISGNSTSDHPMCQDCAAIVIQNQEKILSQTKLEIEALETYLRSLDNNYSSIDNQEVDSEFLSLEKEEQDLLLKLKALQMENEQLDKEIEEEQEKLKLKNIEYDKIVMNYNSKKQILWDLEDDIRSLNQRKKYLSFLAERLKRTNLLNVLFPIWYEDHFATINGFRMGRLPEVYVEWSEINAGLGQCVLLLYNIVRKMDMTLENYKLVPCGNTSYIEALKEKKKLLLYKTGGYKLLPNNKFDQAMIAYLDCLNQVIVRIEDHDSNFKFPYRITEKYKIEESGKHAYSIKLSGNSDEDWTKALKLMLINLKWIMTWMVKASYKQYCNSLQTNQKTAP